MIIRDADLEFERAGEQLRGYAAWPEAPLAGLVLVPDVRGLSEHYRDVSRRFAHEGFFTFAIDLYSREGTPNLPDMQSVFRWIDTLPDPRIVADLDAAADYLGARSELSGKRVGITGFCMGGQYALMSACSNAPVAACVSWYGMLRYRENNEHKPASPLQLATRLSCPYLGLFGAEDGIIPLDDVEELRGILGREAKTHEIEVYAGAGHAFFNDSRPDSYRSDAAHRAWPRAVEFLKQHLAS